MDAAPRQINGAAVILFTPLDERHRPSGACRHVIGGTVDGPAAGLAICQYSGEAGYYLFGCDEAWNTVTDTWHATLDDARAQAEFEYAGVSQSWKWPD
jgi:hypothetical protein